MSTHTPATPDLRLPLEILLAIAEHLPIRTLSAFSRTSRTLHALTTPLLEAYFVRSARWILPWAVRTNRPPLLSRALSVAPAPHPHDAEALIQGVVAAGHTDVLRILVEHGVTPRADNFSYPLALAIETANVEITSILLGAGASLHGPYLDCRPWIPADAAPEERRRGVDSVLKTYGMKYWRQVPLATAQPVAEPQVRMPGWPGYL